MLTNILQEMPGVNNVNVNRVRGSPEGYKWRITFIGNVGLQPLFKADVSFLVGVNPSGLKVTLLKVGILPHYYNIFEATMQEEFLNITGLSTGETYFFYVCALRRQYPSIARDISPHNP